MNAQPTLIAYGLCKSFFGVPVLRDLSLSIAPGEVLGLVGENGAGKSTLMNIIAGNLRPDAGEMTLLGQAYRPQSVRDASAARVAIVHQELNLFENLSIAENLFVNNLPSRFGVLRYRESLEKSRLLLERVGLKLPPQMQVSRLSSGERQLVEIAKALSVDAKLILLDEPTTSLSNHEANSLFEIVHRLSAQGVSVVLITHAIADVLKHCNRVDVLRDGALVASEECSRTNATEVVTKMVGRPIEQLFPARISKQSSSPSPLLMVQGLRKRKTFADINFHVGAGEIVGLFGLVGAGRSELARAVMGFDRVSSGGIQLDGAPIRGSSRKRIDAGMAYITENRRDDGICAMANVTDNATLVGLRGLSNPLGWLSKRRILSSVKDIRASVKLQETIRDRQPIQTLSGGNQQKIVIGKWLLKAAKLYIFDEPTRGIDVGAKREIYEVMQRFARRGCGLMVISSDLEELIGICDRILVMSLGRIRGEFAEPDFDRVKILEAAFAGHDRDAGTSFSAGGNI